TRVSGRASGHRQLRGAGLFDFGNGGAECKAIEALRRVGILEQRISLIMVVCTSLGYEEISTRFPRVAITLGALDDDWTIQGGQQRQSMALSTTHLA
ncbi:hypothetical protein PR003_g27987, partial [Phytophthora rubi]